MHVRTPTQWTALWRETAVRRSTDAAAARAVCVCVRARKCVFVRRARGHHVFCDLFRSLRPAGRRFWTLGRGKRPASGFPPPKRPETRKNTFNNTVTAPVTAAAQPAPTVVGIGRRRWPGNVTARPPGGGGGGADDVVNHSADRENVYTCYARPHPRVGKIFKFRRGQKQNSSRLGAAAARSTKRLFSRYSTNITNSNAQLSRVHFTRRI